MAAESNFDLLLVIYLLVFALNLLKIAYFRDKEIELNSRMVTICFAFSIGGLILSFWAFVIPKGGGITTSQFKSMGINLLAWIVLPIPILLLFANWRKSG